jgi:hypothetical protein
MARALRIEGIACEFLVSPVCARLIAPDFPQQVSQFTGSRAENQALWLSILDRFAPDAVVFADYPLLSFASGTAPLVDDAWLSALDQSDLLLFTLDHLGYASSSGPVFFGPPHLPIGAFVPTPLPGRMQILRPCPTHEPNVASGRPFRSLPPPVDLSVQRREEIRARYTQDPQDLLVLHSTPAWAHQLAAQMGLTHHRFLSRLLEYYLSGLGRQVAVISVNGADLLAPSGVADVRFVNMPMLAPEEYELLMQASDLMLTDNAVSASMAKAVCFLTPCALLCNSYSLPELLEQEDWPGRRIVLALENERPGAIFPFDVFPIWSRDDVDSRGCCDADGYGRTFVRAELFGGKSTQAALRNLLLDPPTQAALRARQTAYVRRLDELPGAADLFRRLGAIAPAPCTR